MSFKLAAVSISSRALWWILLGLDWNLWRRGWVDLDDYVHAGVCACMSEMSMNVTGRCMKICVVCTSGNTNCIGARLYWYKHTDICTNMCLCVFVYYTDASESLVQHNFVVQSNCELIKFSLRKWPRRTFHRSIGVGRSFEARKLRHTMHIHVAFCNIYELF